MSCAADVGRYLRNSIFDVGRLQSYSRCLDNKSEVMCGPQQVQWATGCARGDTQCSVDRVMWQSSAPAFWWSTDFNSARSNLGDFYACQELALRPHGGNQQFCAFGYYGQRFLGLCLPKSCSVKELMTGTESALVRYRELYQLDSAEHGIFYGVLVRCRSLVTMRTVGFDVLCSYHAGPNPTLTEHCSAGSGMGVVTCNNFTADHRKEGMFNVVSNTARWETHNGGETEYYNSRYRTEVDVVWVLLWVLLILAMAATMGDMWKFCLRCASPVVCIGPSSSSTKLRVQ